MINPALFSAAMQRAIDEARRCIGATAPNPPVGAYALDENGAILALASHKRAGESHAEAALIGLCRDKNVLGKVHTIGVTLEPCNHLGRTPPCTESIINAGVKRVVVGIRDPNRQVRGGGIERLRRSGVEVIEGIEAEACRRLIHPFAFHASTGTPFITIKRAFNENGSMIPPKGEKTFSSPESLVLAHRLRKKADALLTGSGTILADQPLFNVRHVPDHGSKRRTLVIMDRRRRVDGNYIDNATERGMDVIVSNDVESCLSDLNQRGVRDLMVEAGPALSQHLLDTGHWTMLIDIIKGTPDRIEISFNPDKNIPFETKDLSLDSLLPL